MNFKTDRELMMRNQKPAVRILFMILILCFHVSVSYTETIDELNVQIGKERQQLMGIEEKIIKQKTKVSTAKKEESSILSKLSIASRSLKITEKELKIYDLEFADIHNKRTDVETKLKEIESIINKQKKLLFNRLRVMYKEGNLSYMKIALSAEDFTDFIQRMMYLGRIAEHDSVIIEDFFQKQKELEEHRLTLLKSGDEIVTLKEKADQKKEQITRGKKEKEKLLGEIREKRVIHEKIQEELEDSSRQLVALIESLEKKRKEAKISSTIKEVRGFTRKKGRLPWPVNGNLISSFGKTKESRFNTYLFNNGIEISSSAGTDIRTIYPGNIIYADWFKGYGKLIIIDHGEGYYSLYGHLDEIKVAVSERVQAGDTIGKTGDTDSINGYNLYFEIRQRGKPEDPIAWLMPQITVHK